MKWPYDVYVSPPRLLADKSLSIPRLQAACRVFLSDPISMSILFRVVFILRQTPSPGVFLPVLSPGRDISRGAELALSM